ncbi:hypothetical protein SLEP1_g22330 [Rubroshorea leprosula]|uniref:No apical meristem-associated C-terminal domain-containing protein n=1 Tax=Rubroshorea leprosula TaxID=152421 RepID=A0AAV5JHN8_9ROSI|nr:hypothetical protein SLEP1_g22330 [Rubroshorea leprosula]
MLVAEQTELRRVSPTEENRNLVLTENFVYRASTPDLGLQKKGEGKEAAPRFERTQEDAWLPGFEQTQAASFEPKRTLGMNPGILGSFEPKRTLGFHAWVRSNPSGVLDSKEPVSVGFQGAEIENQNENYGSNSANATSSSSGGQGPDRSNLNHLVRFKPSGGNGFGGVASLKANRNSNVSSSQSELGNKKGMKDIERFKRYLSKAAQEKNEQLELDINLKDKLEIMKNDAQFYDVLSYWRLKSGRFPILAAMA